MVIVLSSLSVKFAAKMKLDPLEKVMNSSVRLLIWRNREDILVEKMSVRVRGSEVSLRRDVTAF